MKKQIYIFALIFASTSMVHAMDLLNPLKMQEFAKKAQEEAKKAASETRSYLKEIPKDVQGLIAEYVEGVSDNTELLKKLFEATLANDSARIGLLMSKAASVPAKDSYGIFSINPLAFAIDNYFLDNPELRAAYKKKVLEVQKKHNLGDEITNKLIDAGHNARLAGFKGLMEDHENALYEIAEFRNKMLASPKEISQDQTNRLVSTLISLPNNLFGPTLVYISLSSYPFPGPDGVRFWPDERLLNPLKAAIIKKANAASDKQAYVSDLFFFAYNNLRTLTTQGLEYERRRPIEQLNNLLKFFKQLGLDIQQGFTGSVLNYGDAKNFKGQSIYSIISNPQKYADLEAAVFSLSPKEKEQILKTYKPNEKPISDMIEALK